MPSVRLAALKRDNANGTTAKPPLTRSEDATLIMHSKAVLDPYRWLNDSDSAEVRRWVTEQNNYTRGYFDRSKIREHLRRRLQELEDVAHIDRPVPMVTELPSGKLRYFQTRQMPDEEYPVLYYMDGIDGEPKVAVDPNKFKGKGKNPMISWFPYDDGSMVAFAISDQGRDVTTIRVMDLETGKLLKDKIENVTFASVEWDWDKKGFYYSRWPDVKNNPQPKRVNHVYYHKMGTAQDKDKAVFGKGLGAQKSCHVDMDAEGRFLFIYVSDNVNNEVYYKKLRTNASPEIKVLIGGKDAEFFVSDVVDNKAYVLTNYQAPNYRVISFDLDRPSERNWRTVVRESDVPIADIHRHDGRLMVKYLRDGYTEMRAYTLSGKFIRDIDLPIKGHATLPFAGAGDDAYFTASSLVRAPQTYVMNYDDYSVRKYKQKDVPKSPELDMSNFVMRQVWCTSADGTKFPMFMAYKKGVERNGNNPVLLYGYGGFNLASEPEFNNQVHSIVPFLEDGGVYVVANIRGGGEYGTQWYKSGIHSDKQKSYDDFIAAAEWLIEKEWTNSQRLAITGRSNGGLLTAAVMAQRPDLFRAVVSEMPATDMIYEGGYDIFPLCRKEFGDPAVPEDFDFLIKYSPYHNIRQGTRYPSLLVIGGENDTRCDPLHARKFAAIVQNSTSSDNPVLLLIQKGLGHGGSTLPPAKSQQLEWTADWLTFIYEELGMSAEGVRKELQELKRSG